VRLEKVVDPSRMPLTQKIVEELLPRLLKRYQGQGH
jgi:hypothetical protein